MLYFICAIYNVRLFRNHSYLKIIISKSYNSLHIFIHVIFNIQSYIHSCHIHIFNHIFNHYMNNDDE